MLRRSRMVMCRERSFVEGTKRLISSTKASIAMKTVATLATSYPCLPGKSLYKGRFVPAGG